MPREVAVHVWCDPCFTDDVREPGREFTISIDGKPRTLAMCEPHEKELVAPLRLILDEHGYEPVAQEPAPQRGQRGRIACQMPGCGKTYTSPNGLFKHVTKTHGLNGVSYRAWTDGKLTYDEMLAGKLPEGIEIVEHKCPDCDTVFTTAENTYPAQALAAHRSHAHGYRKGDEEAPSETVAEARKSATAARRTATHAAKTAPRKRASRRSGT